MCNQTEQMRHKAIARLIKHVHFGWGIEDNVSCKLCALYAQSISVRTGVGHLGSGKYHEGLGKRGIKKSVFSFSYHRKGKKKGLKWGGGGDRWLNYRSQVPNQVALNTHRLQYIYSQVHIHMTVKINYSTRKEKARHFAKL